MNTQSGTRISRRAALALAGVMAAGASVATKVVHALAGIDEDVSKLVGEQNRIYFDNQPPHTYNFSAPRAILSEIYDATVPKMPATWTVFSLPGYGHIDWCASKGLPIPYGSQLTSPEYARKEESNGVALINLPQPEPNGLYTSGETSATWVLCIRDDQVVPEYHEENVTAYFTPVEVRDGKIVHLGGPASFQVSAAAQGE